MSGTAENARATPTAEAARSATDPKGEYLGRLGAHRAPRNDPAQERVNCAVYFTSASGDSNQIHSGRVKIRQNGFEPQISEEHRTLADQRANVRHQRLLIEKAKGVDIGLSVRILEDAYMNAFSGLPGIHERCRFPTRQTELPSTNRAYSGPERKAPIRRGYE
jgi:hypothetical protein